MSDTSYDYEEQENCTPESTQYGDFATYEKNGFPVRLTGIGLQIGDNEVIPISENSSLEFLWPDGTKTRESLTLIKTLQTNPNYDMSDKMTHTLHLCLTRNGCPFMIDVMNIKGLKARICKQVKVIRRDKKYY